MFADSAEFIRATIFKFSATCLALRSSKQGVISADSAPKETLNIQRADACDAALWFAPNSVDCIVTSPPYWKKRDYGHPAQLGQESSPQQFVRALVKIMDAWRPLLKPSSSVFINLGDSMREGALVGVTSFFEMAALEANWKLLSRIVWAKPTGMPDPHGRLPQRSEFIYHLAPTRAATPRAATSRARPFVDVYAYGLEFDISRGNIWEVALRPTKNAHLAPFPPELARRAILLGCPERVCCACGAPLTRDIVRGTKLDPKRPQARRALELWAQHGLTDAHLAAIRATGICDAGKSLRFQSGAGRNAAATAQLAKEAKNVLGGYFREFTFAQMEMRGFRACACGETQWKAGLVLDPFAGTGTTLRVAQQLGRASGGLDLNA